jgi:hypothetical protein
MITFKKKQFTIQEGQYTGPKDIESIPGALSTIAKGTLGGAGVGAIAGAFMKDSTAIDGAFSGAKWGTISGIAAKLLLNYIHKPMKSIKYQEVDKDIRRQFGVYRMAGITVGDTITKRNDINDKFSFNDRNVDQYKLIFAIHNNQVTMYTFGMTKEELDKTSEILDYYCKKYFAMEYSAKIVNQRVNSYAVDITFTNYQVICNFIMELSGVLKTKIDLLDNNVIVGPRLQDTGEEKTFSVSEINKYDLLKIIGGGLSKGLVRGFRPGAISSVIIEGISHLNKNEFQRASGLMPRGDYNNVFLEAELKKLHYVEGFHYTVGDSDNDFNISLISGILTITTTNDKDLGLGPKVNKSKYGKVFIYTYALKDIKEFDYILNKVMSNKMKPNIFDKKAVKLFSRNTAMIQKITERLDKDGETDYEVSDRIPSDVISITGELNGLKIYIPTDLDYAQYEIDDFIRSMAKFIRTNTITEKGRFVMTLNGNLNFIQYYKLIKNIIKEEGFCTILDI